MRLILPQKIVIDVTTYETNLDNMISRITVGNQETAFDYDADVNRVMKTQGSDCTLCFGPDFEVINGTSTLYVFAGNLRVAKLTESIGNPAVVEYYHKDHLGSTTVMSEEGGSIVDAGEYLPYGLDRSDNALLQSSAYKFTDQEQDESTGLYNYDARMYDPVIGQFVMADTMVPNVYDPQSLNRYAYCLNNPLKYIDIGGHDAIIANRPSGAFYNGHNAILVGNDTKGWEIFSKNGYDDPNGQKGGKTKFSNWNDFSNANKDNQVSGGPYSDFTKFETNTDEDNAMIKVKIPLLIILLIIVGISGKFMMPKRFLSNITMIRLSQPM